ncbi:acyl-CoA dehydrogenase family protein [Sphingosinicella soli]|uniref:Alkylation response protein AidB-like acyl-CoA dehydrogenase n=1 Tax=Sphingosinicella soli TaxID=333708 RepID=A0A7W7B0Y8_9SPHN|nr:acyl-CoA dehydrogenase family protein [Sphingosinicella soli]MBB4631996.1 alkylation response protein AidB-like acyl-CoA dehydrogenase [Sphingosinicella soli]
MNQAVPLSRKVSGADVEGPVARARRLVPLIKAEAETTDKLGTLSPNAVQAFKDAELFWMLVPRDYGGLGCDIVELVETLEEVSYADGSSGWSLMANSLATGQAAVFLQEDAVETMFGDCARPIAAGMPGPGGTADIVDGGYEVQGSFRFGSGCAHANWLISGMLVREGGKQREVAPGQPEVAACYTRRENVEFVGNWEVMGLKGTGSYDYRVPEQFVPFSFALERTVNVPLRGGDHFKVGAMGLGAAGHAGVALGLMKRALEEIAVIASYKKRPAYPGVVGDSPVFKSDFVSLEAQYIAARLMVLKAFGDAQEYGRNNVALDVEQNQRMRQAATFAHIVASDVVRKCHMWSGSEGLRVPSAMGRCLTDMYVATNHVFVDPQTLVNAAEAIVQSWVRRAAVKG